MYVLFSLQLLHVMYSQNCGDFCRIFWNSDGKGSYFL